MLSYISEPLVLPCTSDSVLEIQAFYNDWLTVSQFSVTPFNNSVTIDLVPILRSISSIPLSVSTFPIRVLINSTVVLSDTFVRGIAPFSVQSYSYNPSLSVPTVIIPSGEVRIYDDENEYDFNYPDAKLMVLNYLEYEAPIIIEVQGSESHLTPVCSEFQLEGISGFNGSYFVFPFIASASSSFNQEGSSFASTPRLSTQFARKCTSSFTITTEYLTPEEARTLRRNLMGGHSLLFIDESGPHSVSFTGSISESSLSDLVSLTINFTSDAVIDC